MSTHAIMKFLNHCDELLRAAKLGHDLPKTLLTDGVKCLCQVHKGGIQADILLKTLLLELASCKSQVYSTSSLPETVLTLWKQIHCLDVGLLP